MNRPTGPSRPRAVRAAAIAVAAIGIGYAPIAATEIWPYARPGAPAIGEQLLAHTVNSQYVADAVADRTAPYSHSLTALIVHSVLGAALMLLGPVQLLTAVRRRRRLHRALGTVYAAAVYAAMAAAAAYLARTAPEDAFGGASFWIVLSVILVGTVLSCTFGVLAALTRRPDIHQRWMLLCYGYLMTAPLLRLEWGTLPRFWPGLPMQDINRLALMHLGTLVVLGALLASRATDRRRTVAGLTGSWAPGPLLLAAQLAGALGLTWLGTSFRAAGPEGQRLLVALLVPHLLAVALLLWRRAAAGRAGRGWAREEWSIHLAALGLAPAFSAGCTVLFEHTLHLDRLTALTAGAGIGTGMLAFTATAVVSLRLQYARHVLTLTPPPTAATPVVTPA
ncbi:DUF2306 domain-containing protein [Kitasatospora sp. NPDC048365]|uniref:DUF2306 domain-containing protein n=1 Tax=Kitasatospora sp. NPDC048365 TaxID=3364050 RepID=UPI0037161FD8